MKKTDSNLIELSLDELVKQFGSLYKSEIVDNQMGGVFKKSFKHKLSTEETRDRLLDKKFAYHFLLELKKANYDTAVPYGSAYENNTQPPLSGQNSRLAAVLVYSKAKPDLAPIVVELGNRVKDSLKINETIVSATSRKIDASQKAANFLPLLKPGAEDYNVKFAEGDKASVGQIPAVISKKTYFAGTREETVQMVDTALNKARASLPDQMQKTGDGYTVRMADDIDAFDLSATPTKPK